MENEIIVCPAGKLREAKLRFHGILTENIWDNYDKRLAKLEKQHDRGNSDAKALKTLIQQMEELRNQRDVALAKVEEQAAFIACINQDQASELVRPAIQKLEEEKDIDAALAILDNVKLKEAARIALGRKRERI